MTVSGHGSCAVAVPGGGVAVAATGGDGTTLGSVVCASGGRAARFRGCWCCRGSGADRAATAQVTASETCSCRCVTGVRAGGSWRSAAGVRPLPLRQPGGCGASVTGGGGAGASVTGSRTVTVTGASRTWSGVSRSGSCRCTVSGVSRSERRRCCGPRATWSATGCTMMTGTGASATWSATWSGRAGPAARGAGCGAGRAGASQTPPGGPRLHHPNGDYGSSCHGTRRPVQTAWPAECSPRPTASESVAEPHSSPACLGAGPVPGMGAGACWAGPPGGAPAGEAACAGGEGGSCHPRLPPGWPHRCTGGSRPTGSRHRPTAGLRARSLRGVTGGDRSPRVGWTGAGSLFRAAPWEAPTVRHDLHAPG